MNNRNPEASHLLDNYDSAKSDICTDSSISIATLKHGMEAQAQRFLIKNQKIVDDLRSGKAPEGNDDNKQKYLDTLLVAQALIRHFENIAAEQGDFTGSFVSPAKSLLDSSGKVKLSILPIFSEFTVKTKTGPLVARKIVNGVLKRTRVNKNEPENRIAKGGKILLDLVHTPVVMRGEVKNKDGSKTNHLFVRVRNVNGKNIAKKGYFVSMVFLESQYETDTYEKMISDACQIAGPPVTPIDPELKPEPVEPKPEPVEPKPQPEKPKKKIDEDKVEVDKDGLPKVKTISEKQKIKSPEEIERNYENCYAWYIKMIAALKADLSAYTIDTNHQNPVVRRFKEKYARISSVLNEQIDLILATEDASAKEKYLQVKLLEEDIAFLVSAPNFFTPNSINLESFKRTNTAVRNLNLILSTKMPSEIMEAQMPVDQEKGDPRLGLRDVAIMNGFELNIALDASKQLVENNKGLLEIQASLRKGQRLTAAQKKKVIDSAKFLHYDPTLNALRRNADAFIQRIDFLISFVSSDDTKAALMGTKKLIESLREAPDNFERLINLNFESQDTEVLINTVLPFVVSVGVVAAATLAAPVTGGVSLAAAATFVSATAAGVAGNEVANYIGDEVGRSIYGDLYESHAIVSKSLDGDLEDGLIQAFGKEFAIALFSDLAMMGLGRFLKGSFNKFLQSALNDPTAVKTLFNTPIKQLVPFMRSASQSMQEGEAQVLARFLNNAFEGASTEIAKTALVQLYGSVLSFVKPDVLESQLNVKLSNRVISSENKDSLRLQYDASHDDFTKLYKKLQESESFNITYSLDQNQNKCIVAKVERDGKVFELVFNFKLTDQYLKNDLAHLNDNYNREVYAMREPSDYLSEIRSKIPLSIKEGQDFDNVGLLGFPFMLGFVSYVSLLERPDFEIKDSTGAHLNLFNLLRMKGYTLTPNDNSSQPEYYLDYRISHPQMSSRDSMLRVRFKDGKPSQIQDLQDQIIQKIKERA